MSPVRYLLLMLITSMTVVAAAAAFNLFVDPQAWRPNSDFQIYSTNDRSVKRNIVRKYRHDGLLLGSSKVKRIDPRSLSRPVLFNAAFDGGTPDEFAAYIRDYSQDERLIVLGLDFFMMKEDSGHAPAADWRSFKEPPFYGHSVKEWISYLCSAESMTASVSILLQSRSAAPGYASPAGNQLFNSSELSGPRNASHYSSNLDQLSLKFYRNFKYSDRQLHSLQSIKQWAAEHDAELIVFLNPMNADEAKLIQSIPSTSAALVRFRRDMRALFPDLVDLTEKFPQPSFYFPSDPFHYLPRTGALILERVLSQDRQGSAQSRP